MHITFDPSTLALWESKSINRVCIRFVSGGCSGTKVSVETNFDVSGLESFVHESGITVFHASESSDRLNSARITRVPGEKSDRWIFSSEKVQDRCGCGSSFSFRSKIIPQDKILALRARLGKKEGVCE